MPNHVTNQLTIEADNLDEILEIIKGEDMDIDFNKIIPMPENLHVKTHSGVIEYAKYIFKIMNT